MACNPKQSDIATDAILAAARHLAGRDLYGFLLLDRQLVVTERFGAFNSEIAIGTAVCDVLLPLMGLEAEILALQDDPSQSVDVPNVSVHPTEEKASRLNVSVFWVTEREQYLVLLMRVLSQGVLETELRQQVQARRLAEDAVLQKTKQIARANAELARINKDLEEFAYVISHDLKAPLRALRYLCRDLENMADCIEPESTCDNKTGPLQTIDQIRTQAQRMDAMLDGLLAFARIGQKTDAMEAVDTRLLLDDIIASLPIPNGFRIALSGDFPKFDTLAAPLSLVLRNILENALKHHDRCDGTVQVSVQQKDKEWVKFTISDDGPGIPRDYHEAIFTPFCKVHDAADPTSSGVGLALVKKTADQFNAEITISSDPTQGRGTVFTVSWPESIGGYEVKDPE